MRRSRFRRGILCLDPTMSSSVPFLDVGMRFMQDRSVGNMCNDFNIKKNLTRIYVLALERGRKGERDVDVTEKYQLVASQVHPDQGSNWLPIVP